MKCNLKIIINIYLQIILQFIIYSKNNLNGYCTLK